MSGITLVFGENPDAGAPKGLDDAVEPVEESPTKKWPLEDSMYIKVFKDAIATILDSESFLLCESEVLYLKQVQVMPTEALYILIRLALRKDAWHRKSDYGHYAVDMDHEDKLDQAVRTLCSPQPSNVIKDLKEDVDGDRNAPIDLTCDSDTEGDLPATKVETVEMKQEATLEPPQEDLELSYHALSHDHATPQELLDMLTMDELNKLARDYKLKTTNKKRKELTEAIIKSANSQSTLSFVTRSKPLQQSNVNVKSKSKTGGRLKELCLKHLVHCLKLNPQVLLLIRRINLLFFRTTNYQAQLFVPAILVACKKRTYSLYNSTRTNRVFESREALLQYEEALNLEADVDGVLEKLRAAKKLEGIKTWQDLETKLIELYNTIIQGYNACLGELRVDQRDGLERFEAGYVYARTLYHIAYQVETIAGEDTELQILGNLLGQNRWLLSKRGGCYDRMASIYMKGLKTRADAENAHDIVTRALMDDETRFRYRPKLVRRLTSLENALGIPTAERHTCAGKISKCEDVYILGERLDHIDEDQSDVAPVSKTVRGYILVPSPAKKETKQTGRRYGGKTLWEGEDEILVGVEELALEHYARHGFKGKHCEGRITRFLFALLFHDILFHPSVPGAFETPYQTAPLDLVHDTFYSSRKLLIDARLEELLLPGRALEIVALRDEQLRGDNVFFVGGRWDAFEREEIMEIVEYMPEQVIHDICLVQAQDYEASGGGVPDLILWNVERGEVRFVEVKSTNDKLSETQKAGIASRLAVPATNFNYPHLRQLWIHHLVNAGAAVEVCHVETPADRVKREETKKRNRERAKSRTRSQSVASTATRGRTRRKNLFDEEEALESEEDDAGGDVATSDWETRDVNEVKSEEEEEDVKPYVKGRNRKRGVVKEENEDGTFDVGGSRKRVKTE